MSSFRTRRFGLRPISDGRLVYGSPRTDGPDVSWLHRCRVGDDQGQDGACAIFAFASWAEIMYGAEIPDADCLAVYRKAVAGLGRAVGDGLTFLEALDAVAGAGWLPGAARLVPGASSLAGLAEQPLLAGYAVTPGWEKPNAAGCLDHAAPRDPLGMHAVVVVAHGALGDGPRAVYVENSWGAAWGWRGIGQMREEMHAELVREIWMVRT